MKNSGECPKCGGNEIFTNENKLIKAGASAVAVGHWNRFFIAEYICTNCGFLERYMSEKNLQNRNKMDAVKSKWQALKKS